MDCNPFQRREKKCLRHRFDAEECFQKYHCNRPLNTVLAATTKEGFQVAEQTQAEDGSIELVVTRWDA